MCYQLLIHPNDHLFRRPTIDKTIKLLIQYNFGLFKMTTVDIFFINYSMIPTIGMFILTLANSVSLYNEAEHD